MKLFPMFLSGQFMKYNLLFSQIIAMRHMRPVSSGRLQIEQLQVINSEINFVINFYLPNFIIGRSIG